MKTAHNVKLLNGSKQEVSYIGVETVTMPGTDGQDKVFTAGIPIDAMDISPDFSGGDMPFEAPEGYVVRSATIKKPEGAEQVIAKGQTLAGISGAYVTPGTAKEIEPDFSGGDQIVTAEGDERWSEVTVKKPEGLVPENILNGVDVAGVIGSLSAITAQAIAERSVSGSLYDESVQFVGSHAFANCSGLEAVSFPLCSSVGSHAFANCSSLKEVSIPLCSSVDANTFANCSSLKEVSIPDTMSLHESTFSGCSALNTVTIGCNSNFYTYAPYGVFCNCTSLRNINFMYSGSSVDGKFAFNNPDGSNQFQFANCSSLESIYIIGKGTGGTDALAATIPGYAFTECIRLSDVRFTGQLGAYRMEQSEISKCFDVGAYAFQSCGNLSYLSLSISGLTGIGIGSYAFAYCSKLQDLWLNFGSFTSSGSAWAWLGDSAFYGTPIASSGLTGKFGSIHITKNAYAYLRIASGWRAYSARMVSY